MELQIVRNQIQQLQAQIQQLQNQLLAYRQRENELVFAEAVREQHGRAQDEYDDEYNEFSSPFGYIEPHTREQYERRGFQFRRKSVRKSKTRKNRRSVKKNKRSKKRNLRK